MMQDRILATIAWLLLCAAPMAFADGDLKKDYGDEELAEILRDDGYRAVEVIEERVLRLKIDGRTYTLLVFDDDDLQLYFGLTGVHVTESDMNRWNRLRRLSRAYIDDVGDPVVESDLLANAGYTERQFLEWIDVFNEVARTFHDFVAEADEANSTEISTLQQPQRLTSMRYPGRE